MRIIDRYAYGNQLTRVNPGHKASISLVVIGLCLLLNRPLVGLVATAWMVGLVVGYAKIPAKVFGRLLLAEAAFLVMTTLGVAISVSLEQPEQSSVQIWMLSIGPIWFSTSLPMLYLAGQLITRAVGSAAALNFLAFTTPLVDLVMLLRRYRLPEPLIDIMVIMYRFIFVLLDTLERMVVAQESRLGYQTGYRRTMQNVAQVGARLFVNANQRSQRLETALTARGYDGELRILMPHYRSFPNYEWLMTALIGSLVLAWQISRWQF